MAGRTVTLKVKYADFRQITRSKSSEDYIVDVAVFAALAEELLATVLPVEQGVRLLGVTLSSLADRASLQAAQPEMSTQQRFDFG